MEFSIFDNLIHLKNNKGLEVILSPFGASLYDIIFDNKHMMINYAVNEDFNRDMSAYYGKIVGPYAGRIKDGEYILNNKKYHLPINEGSASLHSGSISYAFKEFNYKYEDKDEFYEVTFFKSFKANEFYPANVDVEVIYRLFEDSNILRVIIKQNSDIPVITRIISHGYFNLGGYEDILFHKLWINAHKVSTYDSDLIPTSLVDVDNVTSFLKSKYITEDIMKITSPRLMGYDHGYKFIKVDKKNPQVILESPRYQMNVYTDTTGVQIYTDNFPRENNLLNNGFIEKKYSAIAIEPMDIYLKPEESITNTYKRSFKLEFLKK